MTVDAANSSTVQAISEDGPKTSAALRDQGLQKLRAGELAQAIEILSHAAER